MTSNLPGLDYLMECFAVDFDRGVVVWKARPPNHFKNERDHLSWNTRFKGKEAGHNDSQGYKGLRLGGKSYRIHRIIYLMYHGHCAPDMEIDHINGLRNDNRISNLRLVTHEINSSNRKGPTIKSSTGIRGVSLKKSTGKFAARIRVSGKQISLGSFINIDDAAIAATEARSRMFVGAQGQAAETELTDTCM